MRTKINRFLSSNLCLWLLSLLLSTCLWMIVINANDPATTRTFRSVPVKVINKQVLTKQGKTYTIEDGDTISFSIRGKKSIVDKMKKSDFDVTADLQELSSVHSVPIKVTAQKYSSSLEILYNNNEVMTVSVDSLLSKKFDVVASLSGTPANGYSVGEVTISPKTITIQGPAKQVSKVASVKVNASVDNATETVNVKTAPNCYDKDGNRLVTDDLDFSASMMKVKVAVGASKTVPIKVSTKGSPADGYQIASVECSPSKLKVTGSDTAMKAISEITLPDVKVSGATENVTKEVKASSISLPKGISLLDSSIEIKIKVVINQAAADGSVKVSSRDIKINGVSDDMNVEFLESSISLSVSGNKKDVEALSAEDFHPSIDVSGLSEGKHIVNVSLKDISGIKVKGSPQIRIKISNVSVDTTTEEEDTESED